MGKQTPLIINDSLIIEGNLVVDGSIYNTEVISAVPGGTITNNYCETFIEGSETGKTDWATRIAGTSTDIGFGISLNDNGDIVVTGSYRSNPVTIYNADGTTAATLANSNNSDVFVAKYNCEGTLEWTTRIAGSGNDEGFGISLNNNGDIVVTGSYQNNSVTIYNADGTTGATLVNSGLRDVFIAKYNCYGVLQWATRIAGSNNESGYGISQNDNGDIAVTGSYSSNPVTIYNADGSTGATLINSGVDDAFVVKYNCGGTVQWVTRIAGSIIDIGNGISLNNNGDIVVAGVYSNNPVMIYNADGTIGTTLANDGDFDTFIVKYNCGGTVQWATRIAGSLSESGNGISLNDNGDIVVTGLYTSNELRIYNASGTTAATLTNINNVDSFVVKYNCGGIFQWATRIAGSESDQSFGISLNDNDEIAVTGSYRSNPVTIYNADGSTGATLPNDSVSMNSSDAFVAKYNCEGILQWAAQLSVDDSIIGNGISLNNNAETVVTGFYNSSTITIYNADGTTGATLVNSGLADTFIVKYTDNINMLLESGNKTGNKKTIISDGSQLKINAQIKDDTKNQRSKIFLRDCQSISLRWSEKSNKWLVHNKKGANIV